MQGPFANLPLRTQGWLFGALLVLTLVWMACMTKQAAPLKERLPAGVVALEVPWSTRNAEAILNRLGIEGRALMRRNTEMDFLFLLLYPLTISLWCALVAQAQPEDQRTYAAIFGWAALAAMPLDALENVAMLIMLGGNTEYPVPQACTIVSTLKWGVFLGSFGYALASSLALGGRWLAAHIV